MENWLDKLFAMEALEREFIDLCSNGDLEKCKSFYAANPGINISADNERAYCFACSYGHLHIIKWLLDVKPNINTAASYGVIYSYSIGQPSIHKLIMHYSPRYVIFGKAMVWIHRNYKLAKLINGLWDLV